MCNVFCENRWVVKHTDSRMIKRLKDAWRRSQMAEEFLPAPKELPEGEELSNWRAEHWGVAEDFGQGDDKHKVRNTGDGIELRFRTISEFPLAYYDELVRLGFEIDAFFLEFHYPENGMESDRSLYCGRINASGRSCFTVRCLAPKCLRKFIPDEELLRSFDFLSHALEEVDDEDEEDAWWTCDCDPEDVSWGWPFWPDSTFTKDDAARARVRALESGLPQDGRIANAILFRAITFEELLAMFKAPRDAYKTASPETGD